MDSPEMQEQPESEGDRGSFEKRCLTRGDLLRVAESLAREILDNRLYAEDGTQAWQGPRSPWRGSRAATAVDDSRTVPIGPHLYSGSLGIAVFLAALARVTGNVGYRAQSLQIIAPLRHRLGEILRDEQRAARIRFGMGGLTGLGSFIYSFLILGRLLKEPDLTHEAHASSCLVTPERIVADEVLDIMTGCAGTILALLALDAELPQTNRRGVTPLEIATLCAEHLLSRQTLREDGLRTWKTLPTFPPLTGFAHGAAGICHALLRLYERTGREEFRVAALYGLDFERWAYTPEQKNWRDLRFEEPKFMNSWCYGAPGIALGRLACLNIVDDMEIREEIQNGLTTTRNLSLGYFDNICCGNMGRVEVLLYAARELENQALYKAAWEIADQVLARAETEGFHWMLGTEDFDPAFFSGAAGVGYCLLRLAAVRDLPYLILLE